LPVCKNWTSFGLESESSADRQIYYRVMAPLQIKISAIKEMTSVAKKVDVTYRKSKKSILARPCHKEPEFYSFCMETD
jgi:hypothetical protein